VPKDAPYFAHDADARNDPKMVDLTAKYGMAGRGRWWTLVEILRSQDGYRLPMKPYVAHMLASEWMLGEEEAKQFLVDLTNEFDLIHSDSEWMWSERLIRRMARLDSLRGKQSEGGYTGAARKYLPASERREGEAAEPTVVDPQEVEKTMTLAGRSCTEVDARTIAAELGQHGGTVDTLAFALKQIRGPVRSPVGYVISMIRQDIVLHWKQAGSPEAPKRCPECRVAAPYHAESCSRLGSKATE
jgi:hypothetical protein